jgi:RNA polymerase sigma-70 factor (ECF subfamily)
VSVLVRVFGDIDIAEEAVQDAFAEAVRRWPSAGLPPSPAGWIITTARNRAIDRLRREAARADKHAQAALLHADLSNVTAESVEEGAVPDERLRLIFTCCHPALPADAQIALTLREVCGLTTEEIARAFLSPAPTLAQRIVRAKAKIKAAKIPYQVPSRAELPDRLATVLHVIYLVFNEGYSASTGDALTRPDLSAEAIRLGRLLMELLPEPEVVGLLSLMLLHASRQQARTSADGELVLLDDQNRSLWNRGQIEEGIALVRRALGSRGFGPYTLQAAIAAIHAEALRAADTDWSEIVGLYDVLMRTDPSPIIELNRAAAVAMRDGPEAGLVLIDALLDRGELRDYALAHSARAELCRRLWRRTEAMESYRKALELTRQEPQRRFIANRLAGLASGQESSGSVPRRPA